MPTLQGAGFLIQDSGYCDLEGAKFCGADLQGADLRGCSLKNADFRGADIRLSTLENADLTGARMDETTVGYPMRCPEKGAFVAYKKCVYDRIVQLLVPADAKRSSATGPTCRCDKAKVLTIRNFDGTREFDEAWSLVDENFVYRKGSGYTLTLLQKTGGKTPLMGSISG